MFVSRTDHSMSAGSNNRIVARTSSFVRILTCSTWPTLGIQEVLVIILSVMRGNFGRELKTPHITKEITTRVTDTDDLCT